jgi:hypothetical protein
VKANTQIYSLATEEVNYILVIFKVIDIYTASRVSFREFCEYPQRSVRRFTRTHADIFSVFSEYDRIGFILHILSTYRVIPRIRPKIVEYLEL